MTWNGTGWDKFKFQEDKNSDNNVYRVNSYRVLLTRGRDGFIIFVPPTSALDPLYTMLRGLGIKELGIMKEMSFDSTDTPAAPNVPAALSNTGLSPNRDGIIKSGRTLKKFFESNGLKTIDKRANGGCLWAVGDEATIGNIVDSAKEEFGARGNYGAGKQTHNQPGWWTKCEK